MTGLLLRTITSGLGAGQVLLQLLGAGLNGRDPEPSELAQEGDAGHADQPCRLTRAEPT